MNTVLSPNGSPCLSRPRFQPFRPQPPHRPSHGICSRSRFVSARGRRPEDPARCCGHRDLLPQGSWPGLRTALAGSPVGLAESGLLCVMSFMSLRYGRVVHLRQPPTSCCHDAVAIGHRRVNFRLTGTSTPQCECVCRRTRQLLAELEESRNIRTLSTMERPANSCLAKRAIEFGQMPNETQRPPPISNFGIQRYTNTP